MNKILVIEDEAKMLRNILAILKMESFEAFGAADGLAGLELAKQELPDLILCDVSMPGLNGHEVLERLRADRSTIEIPFIFLTAREKDDIRKGMNLGADDYLCKPCPAVELLEAIGARLKRQRDMEEAVARNLALPASDFSSPAPLEKLGVTPREAEVLLWVAQGKANADIAIILGMAVKTVKVHVGHIMEKLGVENRTSAARVAIESLNSQQHP